MQDLLQIRTHLVNFHVLRDEGGLYLIDGGFIGGIRALEKALKLRGWQHEKIVGILITHGHLDHILNVGKLSKETGAWIAAPKLDLPHCGGRARYTGWSRVAGILEAIGRPLLDFRSFTPDRLLDDNEKLDIWHGLQAIHLPGHTAGHMGFYCESRKLLFCGDLFASYQGLSHLPPKILNNQPDLIKSSIEKALALPLDGILPNHADKAVPEIHLKRLIHLHEKFKAS